MKIGHIPLARGLALLQDPLHNKGTAFTEIERDALGLRGLLPPHIHTQDEQMARFLENMRSLSDPLEKFIALSALHDRNEALFFRVVCDKGSICFPCRNWRFGFQHWCRGRYRRSLIPLGFQPVCKSGFRGVKP
jgi:hypothetical protein